MLVLLEDAAEAIASSYLEMGDLVWIGDRRGESSRRPSNRLTDRKPAAVHRYPGRPRRIVDIRSRPQMEG
jgi:hypothetical protein